MRGPTTLASLELYHPLISAIEPVPDQAMLILDWTQLDVATLKSLVTSQAGIDALVAVRGRDAVVVMDVLEEVNRFCMSCPLLIRIHM